MRFAIFVIDDATNTGNAAELAAIDAFNAQLQESEQFVLAIGIAGPSVATVFDNRDSKGEQKSESLQGKPFYSGLWLINSESHEDANQLAMQASLACNRRVELRPLLGG